MTNDPLTPGQPGKGETRNLGDLQVSTGRGTADISIELILYLLVSLGIFVASAIVDENDGAGFTASQAWFYVTLLTVGFLISRGLAKINSRGDAHNVL